jgi:hypothetical protein
MLRSPRVAIAVLGLSIASLPVSGCSWIFTQPLRDDRSPYDYPVCSTSPAPPVVDTLLFVANAGSTTYLALQDNVNQKALWLSLGFTEAALWFLSATYGFSKINACIDAVGNHNTVYLHPIGTGGEVFLTPPPATPPQPAERPKEQPRPDREDPQHPAPASRPPALPEKPDAPRFGN